MVMDWVNKVSAGGESSQGLVGRENPGRTLICPRYHHKGIFVIMNDTGKIVHTYHDLSCTARHHLVHIIHDHYIQCILPLFSYMITQYTANYYNL